MRRVAFGASLLMVALMAGAPVSAASATSWQATVVGEGLRGGATTLIRTNGTGSVNVKVYGLTPGTSALVAVNPASCPAEAQHLVSFLTADASAEGIATGKLVLTESHVKAYNAALTARTPLSILIVAGNDRGCGDQVGAPAVGTARLKGTVDAVGATYDLRYPVVRGLLPGDAGAKINSALQAQARATIAQFSEFATRAGPADEGGSTANQTFSVSLNERSLLSLAERYVPDLIGAPHGDDHVFTFTFDVATGRRMTLPELFRPGSGYLRVLARESAIRLAPRVGSLRFAQAMAAPTAESFEAWQLTPTGLQISFAMAQGFGIPVTAIEIPWPVLRPTLNLGSRVAVFSDPGPCPPDNLSSPCRIP